MAHQMKVVFVLLLSMIATAFALHCPDGWEKYEYHCFKYEATATDWSSAETYCLSHGGHLISIHNEEEYQKAKAVIRAIDPSEKPTWVGLYRQGKNKNWFWSDGTKLTFTKWNPGEPNNFATEFCALVDFPHGSGVKDWNDATCDDKNPFLCARRAECM